MTERLVSGTGSDNDAPLEGSLRPRRLEDFTGQDRIKEHLRIAIIATQRRKEPLDHRAPRHVPGLLLLPSFWPGPRLSRRLSRPRAFRSLRRILRALGPDVVRSRLRQLKSRRLRTIGPQTV